MRLDDSDEHSLVLKAFQLAFCRGGYVTGYVEWNERGAANSFKNLSSLGFTPDHVRIMLIEFVSAGGTITQHRETRPEWSEYRYYYRMRIPIDQGPRSIFVECRLNDNDPDDPAVVIVSAHLWGH